MRRKPIQMLTCMGFALTVATGAMTLSIASAQAMQIYNCTGTSMPVNVSDSRTGQNFGTGRVAPGEGLSWSTGAGNTYDVRVQTSGPTKRFKNQNGQALLSIAMVGGQAKLLNGYQCQQMAKAPQRRAKPSGGRSAGNKALETAVVGAVLGIIVHHATKN